MGGVVVVVGGGGGGGGGRSHDNERIGIPIQYMYIEPIWISSRM